MNMNLLTLVIISSCGIEACSTTYVLTKAPQQSLYFETQYISYEELMAKCLGETITIVMRDSNRVSGTLVQVDSATVAWIDAKAGSIRSIPTSQVEHLELSRNYVWEGATLGLLLVTVPALATGAWGPQQPGGPKSINYDGRYFLVTGGVLGGFLGAGVGSAIKHKDIVQILPLAGGSATKSGSTK